MPYTFSCAPIYTNSISKVHHRPEKISKIEDINSSLRFKTCTKWQRAISWWNPTAQMCPVLDLSSFVPIPKLKCQNPLLSYVQERET
jgi:hypothetical protein